MILRKGSKPFMDRQRGFTLVEIAVVLVIAALILAALLNADSILRASRVQDAIALAQDLTVAANNFKQRYHLLPGDFPVNPVTPEFSVGAACWKGTQKGDGNGRIDSGGNANGALGVPAEVQCVPEVLFQAGMVNKVEIDTGVSVFRTRFGGRVWLKFVGDSNVVAAGFPVPAFSPSITHVIEFENMPCAAARDIDRQIDNDNLTSGRGAASVPACVGDDLVSYALAF
jgi:prepilin-type N-terminal cleavage/methylation domain-containing protein